MVIRIKDKMRKNSPIPCTDCGLECKSYEEMSDWGTVILCPSCDKIMLNFYKECMRREEERINEGTGTA